MPGPPPDLMSGVGGLRVPGEWVHTSRSTLGKGARGALFEDLLDGSQTRIMSCHANTCRELFSNCTWRGFKLMGPNSNHSHPFHTQASLEPPTLPRRPMAEN